MYVCLKICTFPHWFQLGILRKFKQTDTAIVFKLYPKLSPYVLTYQKAGTQATCIIFLSHHIRGYTTFRCTNEGMKCCVVTSTLPVKLGFEQKIWFWVFSVHVSVMSGIHILCCWTVSGVGDKLNLISFILLQLQISISEEPHRWLV